LVADKNNAYATETGEPNPQAWLGPLENGDDWNDWSDNGGNNPRHGNSKNHGSNMQNVAFADTHVDRTRTPLVGIRQDNIYTRWPNTDPTEDGIKCGRWDGGNAMHMDDDYLGN